MALPEEKLQVLREIARMDDDRLLEDIKRLIYQYKREEGMPHSYADDASVSFEEWLKQYDEETGRQDTFLPEYQMTLREFRQHVYHQERRSNNLD